MPSYIALRHEGKGWYEKCALRRPDGKTDLPMLPLRCVPHGSVGRKLEPDRYRRVVENFSLCTTDSAISLNYIWKTEVEHKAR